MALTEVERVRILLEIDDMRDQGHALPHHDNDEDLLECERLIVGRKKRDVHRQLEHKLLEKRYREDERPTIERLGARFGALVAAMLTTFGSPLTNLQREAIPIACKALAVPAVRFMTENAGRAKGSSDGVVQQAGPPVDGADS